MSLGGVFSSGRMHLNSVTFIDDFHNPFKVIPEPIDLKALKLSTLIAKGIQTLFANEKENGAYLRLRKGFNAFISSTKEKQAHTRLHGFVRAIEAVIKPRRGGATEQFVERGQFFAGNVAKAQTILRELYELRSAAEHLNPMKDKLLVYPADQRENVLATRTYQSELLASHALRTILLDQSLLERFETDDTTGDFWKQTPDQLLRTWGQTIDLEAALDGTFYDYL